MPSPTHNPNTRWRPHAIGMRQPKLTAKYHRGTACSSIRQPPTHTHQQPPRAGRRSERAGNHNRMHCVVWEGNNQQNSSPGILQIICSTTLRLLLLWVLLVLHSHVFHIILCSKWNPDRRGTNHTAAAACCCCQRRNAEDFNFKSKTLSLLLFLFSYFLSEAVISNIHGGQAGIVTAHHTRGWWVGYTLPKNSLLVRPWRKNVS